ncbi:NnrS family protein [Guyparkeria halophila]|nr:NnrS family protein [Guyparkeria halophila]
MTDWRRWPVLSVGFRPWFLMMLGFATLAMGLWAAVWIVGGWGAAMQGLLDGGQLDWRWHAHEMIFGVGVALVAGFLTTAAQNWTGRRAWHPAGLLAVLGIWLAARLAFLLMGGDPLWPYLLSIAAELGILFVVARLILLSRQWHNLLFVLALTGMVLADALFALLRHDGGLAGIHGWLGLLPIVAMLLFIAQRVVPPFSANRLGIPPRRTGRYVAFILGGGPLLLLVVLLAKPVAPNAVALVGATIATVVALTGGYALTRWWHRRVLTEPMLWLLFLGVSVVLLGLVWLAAVLAGLPAGGLDGPVHALGLGMLVVMAMGMMTRVSAGHTGRPIHLPRRLRPMLVLMLAVVAGRLLLPIWPGLEPVWLAVTAGGLALVYLAMLLVIGPWLVHERADARPPVRRS